MDDIKAKLIKNTHLHAFINNNRTFKDDQADARSYMILLQGVDSRISEKAN